MDNRLMLTQSRLASLRMHEPRLKNLAGEPNGHFVAKNIGLFLNDTQKRAQLTKLPAEEKQLVLDELTKITCINEKGDMSAFKQKREAVGVLLSSETRSFDLNWLLNFCPQRPEYEIDLYIKLMLKLIASRAPNISELSLEYESRIFMSVDEALSAFDIWPLGDEMSNSISRMTNLKTLRLTKYSVAFSEMIELSKSLANLEILDVVIAMKNFKAEVKIKDLKLLSNLKEFSFNVYVENDEDKSKKFRVQLALLCLKNLPNLEIIGDQNGDGFYLELKPDFVLKKASNLRQLAVLANDPLTENHCQMMSSVTDLKIKWNQHNYRENVCAQLLELKKVDSLSLETIPSIEMWHSIILKYGGSLHSLSLMNLNGSHLTLSFKKIFTLCPNLQKLILAGVEVVEESEPYDPKKTFAPLKVLTWNGQLKRTPAIMSKILLAPNLEELSLNNIEFDQKDVEEVSNLVAKGETFKQLNYFEINLIAVTKENFVTFIACTELFKNVCAFAPKVAKVLFGVLFCDLVVKQNGEGLGENGSDKESSSSSEDDDDPSTAEIFRNLGEDIINQFIASFH